MLPRPGLFSGLRLIWERACDAHFVKSKQKCELWSKMYSKVSTAGRVRTAPRSAQISLILLGRFSTFSRTKSEKQVLKCQQSAAPQMKFPFWRFTANVFRINCFLQVQTIAATVFFLVVCLGRGQDGNNFVKRKFSERHFPTKTYTMFSKFSVEAAHLSKW